MDNRTQRQKQAQAERQKALKFQRTVRAAAIVLALVLALISLAQSCSTKKAIEDLAAQIRAGPGPGRAAGSAALPLAVTHAAPGHRRHPDHPELCGRCGHGN